MNPFKEVNEEFSDSEFKVKGSQHSHIMSDNFSKIPIDFSKYRELLSDDNPKIPEDRFPSEAFMQNQGDKIGLCPVCNLYRKDTAEQDSLDDKEVGVDDRHQLNPEPAARDQVDMSSQVNQNRDENVNPVNTYKEEVPKPWELSDDEHPSPTETNNPDQVKVQGYGKISNPNETYLL